MEPQERHPQLQLISQKDQIFAGQHYPRPFSFNEEVAGVFDDMVRRSIPWYCDVTRYVGDWCERFHRNGDVIIDIGCSTGTTLHHIANRLSTNSHLIGIDQSSAMIERAKEKLRDIPQHHQCSLIHRDIMEVQIPQAVVVIMNYTLQFLPVAQRSLLLDKIYQALKPGGLLFLSEKVRYQHPLIQETTTYIYEKFKYDQGYSQTEIARKKEALEHVLIPFTEDEHRKTLQKSGFATVETVMKWNNFTSFVAIKDEL